jgi:hypothetical protein
VFPHNEPLPDELVSRIAHEIVRIRETHKEKP